MVKILFSLLIAMVLDANMKNSCLACHEKNQIPDEIIYKRYLLKYSTDKNIKNAIISYLKKPNQKNSVMPSIFFSKFPMKKKMDVNEYNTPRKSDNKN
jgi:hypothetical protein